MKYLVLLFLLFSSSMCSSQIKITKEVDSFSGETSVYTNRIQFGNADDKNGTIFGSVFYDGGDLISVNLTVVAQIGCLSNYDGKMLVKLSNDDIIEFANIADTDCDDFPSGIFIPISRENMEIEIWKDIVSENIDKLMMNDWTNIRIYGTDYYKNFVPRTSRKVPNPERFFIDHFQACFDEMNN